MYPNLRGDIDRGGLLPGPDFTGDRNPLPAAGPTQYPGIPFPGQSQLTPFEEALRALASHPDIRRLTLPPQLDARGNVIEPLPDPQTDAGRAEYEEAYRNLRIGGPGTGLPSSTVRRIQGDPRNFELPGDYAQEVIAREAGGGGAYPLMPSDQIVPHIRGRIINEEAMRQAQNVGRGLVNVMGPIGAEAYPQHWPQNPGGYPTMPGGIPMPYDHSLPVGGGNVSPGAPGLPGHIPIQGPPPPPPQPYPGAPPGDWNPNSSVPGIGYPSGTTTYDPHALPPWAPLPPVYRNQY